MIRTMTAITSRMWIRLPPTCPMKPRSHSTTKMTIIVQSMVFLSVELNFRRRIYSEFHLFAKLFSEHGVETFGFLNTELFGTILDRLQITLATKYENEALQHHHHPNDCFNLSPHRMLSLTRSTKQF